MRNSLRFYFFNFIFPPYITSFNHGHRRPCSCTNNYTLNGFIANKRIVNLGLELMGARTLQRLAAENDGRAHLAPGTKRFRRVAKEQGIKAALTERDRQFGDGRARVDGPEIRDAQGRLIET